MNPELEALKAKLKARTDSAGKAKGGFAENVEAIKARIAELEARSGH